jgi:hypothetical protein
MKTLTFGIEIETVGVRRPAMAEAIATALGGRFDSWDSSVVDAQGRTWRVVSDGSLSGSVNGEVVSPILRYEDMGDLMKVIRALADAGCQVDPSTAIHIHIGTRGIATRALTNLMKMVYKNERLIEHALGVQQARLGRYCRPIDESLIQRIDGSRRMTAEDLNRAWYGRFVRQPNRYDDTRYHGVNLNSHYFRGTTELRFFEGTLDSDKVKAYVQFALALVAAARDAKTTSSERRGRNSHVGLPPPRTGSALGALAAHDEHRQSAEQAEAGGARRGVPCRRRARAAAAAAARVAVAARVRARVGCSRAADRSVVDDGGERQVGDPAEGEIVDVPAFRATCVVRADSEANLDGFARELGPEVELHGRERGVTGEVARIGLAAGKGVGAGLGVSGQRVRVSGIDVR